MSLHERVRLRLRDLIEAEGYTQREVGEHLQIDRTTVSRTLTEGGLAVTFDFLEGVSYLLQRMPQELIADPGSPVIVASPLEVQLVARLREMTELERQALLTVIDWRMPLPRGRRKHAAYPSPADSELLGLFHALDDNPTAQAAVLSVLRAQRQTTA